MNNSIYNSQLLMSNLTKIKWFKRAKDLQQIEKEVLDITSNELTQVKWIWVNTQTLLYENGIRTVADLLETDEEKLAKIIKSPISLKSILEFKKQ